MEQGIIKQLAAEISAQIAPAVPVSVAYWDKKAICACLKVSESSLNKMMLSPDFPAVRRFPASSDPSKRGFPRWRAKDIIEWAETYKCKDAAL